MAEISEQLSNAKKYITRTNLLAIGAFLLIVVASIVFSIPSIVIDPSQVFTMKFLTKQLVTISIGTTAMVCWIFIGKQNNGLQPLSKLYKARDKFKVTKDKIVNDDYLFGGFEQWVKQSFHPEQQEEKNKSYLKNVGINNFKYLDLDFNTLKELTEHSMKIEGCYYKQLSKEQYKALLNVLKGKTEIKFLKWSDYLSERIQTSQLGLAEFLSLESKTLRNIMLKEVASKIIFGLLIGAIFISVVVDQTQPIDVSGLTPEEIEAINVARAWETWMNLISRLFNAIWSAFMGYLVGIKINDEMSLYLEDKNAVHKKFLNDRNFKIKSEQELAREEWINEQKEINKQANLEYAKQIGLRAEE